MKTVATIGVMFIGLAVIFVYENVLKLWQFEKKSNQPEEQPQVQSSWETSSQNVY